MRRVRSRKRVDEVLDICIIFKEERRKENAWWRVGHKNWNGGEKG